MTTLAFAKPHPRRCGRPHEFLLMPLPSSPFSLLDKRLPNLAASTLSSVAIRASTNDSTLAKTVLQLSHSLRFQRSIEMPSFFPWTSMCQPDRHAYHSDIIVAPVLALLSQIRARVFEDPLDYSLGIPVQDISVVKVTSNSEMSRMGQKLPVMPQDLLNTSRHSSHLQLPLNVAECLHDIWKQHPESPIICSDLISVIILHPPSVSEKQETVFESLLLDSSRSALRVVIAAYICAALPDFIAQPFRFNKKLPLGCAVDPAILPESDQKVFRTHHCHDDFDFFTLTQDQTRALQFFRWKVHALATAPRPLTAGAQLLARTDAYAKREQQSKPYFAMEELRPETSSLIQSTRRKDMIHSTVQLSSSSFFSIEILRDLTPSEPPAAERECTTYRCRLVSVDGNAVRSGAKLCVKLFDDRQVYMQHPSSELVEAGLKPMWWTNWRRSAESVGHEHASYTRLRCLQGSLLPWYYGAHEFTLPDGRVLYGILMEFVEAPSLKDLHADLLSEPEQIQLIRSIRLIVSALERADVSQHDWHYEQLLCPRHPVHGYHAVLIDLAATSTTIDPDVHHGIDDVQSCCYMLSDSNLGETTGLRKDLLETHFLWREEWDPRPIRGADLWFDPPGPYQALFKDDLK